MKIPVIEFTDKDHREEYLLCPTRELEPVFANIIMCYSKEQAKAIVDYYLETGIVEVWYKLTDVESENVLKKYDKLTKLYVWKHVARVRQRPAKIGGNMLEGEFFK